MRNIGTSKEYTEKYRNDNNFISFVKVAILSDLFIFHHVYYNNYPNIYLQNGVMF